MLPHLRPPSDLIGKVNFFSDPNGGEKFHCRTLESLLETRDQANRYLGVSVTVTDKYYTNRYVSWDREFRAVFSCIGCDCSIVFDRIIWKKRPPQSWKPIRMDIIGHQCATINIKDITLSDGGQSIKNVLLDACRLKSIEYAIYEMADRFPAIEPLGSKYRNRYLNPSTTNDEKQRIGKRMMNIEIPMELDCPLFRDYLELWHYYILNSDQNEHDNHDNADMKEDTKEDITEDMTVNVSASKRNYMDWDGNSEPKMTCSQFIPMPLDLSLFSTVIRHKQMEQQLNMAPNNKVCELSKYVQFVHNQSI